MNLTISLDEAVVKQARIRAIEEGTSLSAKIRDMLAVFGQYGSYREDGSQEMRDAWARVMGWQLANTSSTQSAPELHGLRAEMYAGDFRARDQNLAAAVLSARSSNA